MILVIEVKHNICHLLLITISLILLTKNYVISILTSTELRRRKIVFRLQQDGNATVVVLMTKTAYLKQSPGSKVNLGLRKRNSDLPNGWEGIQKHKVLYWVKYCFHSYSRLNATNSLMYSGIPIRDPRFSPEMLKLIPESRFTALVHL